MTTTLSPAPAASAPLSAWIAWYRDEHGLDPQLSKILRWSDVENFTTYGRTAIKRGIADGTFPKPFRLHPAGRAKGFDYIEILAWKARMMALGSLGELKP
jgi:predicted DNA-binding transcriptional regulator AlpA